MSRSPLSRLAFVAATTLALGISTSFAAAPFAKTQAPGFYRCGEDALLLVPPMVLPDEST